eukprot:TRINITY_DN2622_c0_g1_i1.p1 TRINITY_DN2622_c0_g1~~TRINITY_DN2622_c0_g1_i1.p1  ORF type:complete len:247 (+),score=49.48 TRINITY_DN2622_c0_g1_i1:172-912(+)
MGCELALLVVAAAAARPTGDVWAETTPSASVYNPYKGDASDAEYAALEASKACVEICEAPCRVSDGQLLESAKPVTPYKVIDGIKSATFQTCKKLCTEDEACSVWTFKMSRLECLLYHRLQPFDTDPTRADSMIAGCARRKTSVVPAGCPALGQLTGTACKAECPMPCKVCDSSVTGTSSAMIKVSKPNQQECGKHCRLQQECHMWTYDSRLSQCFLYDKAVTFDQDYERAAHMTAGCVRTQAAQW